MNKYHNRLNRLRMKTHRFVLYSELCFIRDYFKIRLEDGEPLTEVALNQSRLCLKLLREHLVEGDERKQKEAFEIMRNDIRIADKVIHEIYIENCLKHPRGLFVEKSNKDVEILIAEAKQYFRAFEMKV